MTLRADHVAGGFFVLFGLLVIALSGDLPVGQLSMPGSGFLPMIVAVLTIVFGLALIVRAGAYSAAVVLFTYVCFSYLLKTPMPESPFGF